MRSQSFRNKDDLEIGALEILLLGRMLSVWFK